MPRGETEEPDVRPLATSDSPAVATDSVLPRNRIPLISLISAEAVAMLGNRTMLVAVPWLVLVTTGSPARMGLIGAAAALALVAASVFGAPLVDRFGMRRVSILADVVAAGALAVIATGHYGGFASLVALMAAVSALNAVSIRAKRVLLAPVAELGGAPMRRITAIYEGLSRSANLVGASMGGVLIAAFSAQHVIWLNAVALLVCASTIASLVRLDTTADDSDDPTAPREPYLAALRSGFDHVRRDRLLSTMMGLLVLTNLVNQAMSSVLLPLWASEVIGSPVALGLVGTAFSTGAILGNIVFAVLAERLPRYYTITIGYLIGGAPRFLALIVSHQLGVVLAVMFVSGISLSTVNPTYGSLLYERVPARLRARVFGLSAAVTTAGMPLGGLLGGFSVAQFGLRGGLVAAAAVYFVATLIPVVYWRIWRDLDRIPGATRSPDGPPPWLRLLTVLDTGVRHRLTRHRQALCRYRQTIIGYGHKLIAFRTSLTTRAAHHASPTGSTRHKRPHRSAAPRRRVHPGRRSARRRATSRGTRR